MSKVSVALKVARASKSTKVNDRDNRDNPDMDIAGGMEDGTIG